MFPPFLNQGSSGNAVDFLSRALILRGFMQFKNFESGTFPTEAVKNLQRSLGFTDSAVDGNFGKDTRNADFIQNKIFWDSIPATPGKITKWYGPSHKGGKIWPTSKEE